MKNPEQIGQLANEFVPDVISDYQRGKKDGFMAGYNAAMSEGWISVKEQKPEDYQPVLNFDSRDGEIYVGHHVPSQSDMPGYITHYKPLPEPPK